MDKTLSDYDQSLEELERQREHLELVMKKMGQEWEESGAGIGWMGSLDINGDSESSTKNDDTMDSCADTQQPQQEHRRDRYPATPLSPDSCSADEAEPKPLLNLMQQHPTGPSPDYLQSLLNVNEALLAQSLTTKPLEGGHPELQLGLADARIEDAAASILSPPITPEEYSQVRASCLSRGSSLAKRGVRQSNTSSTSTSEAP